ncbi:hypothetical protein FB567DRAFT_431769 [Paraphoma chrysanthemicola]|uniref:Uncharacterized protein n=1 Tax=Paraphoma chrysanthemicola TaxID=798071 RepID=A0A8K0RGG2_9PLEO|nr:hypothetical protein FB567DRAFT_431769 [Paraphoma chrysanthemicola]
MSSGSVTVPPDEGVAPLNFIYACQICCYSFADVYEGRNETVRGLSDGINPKERLVTHLYLASCCHVFCGSHLEGGGPAFHPDGQRPKAPCPVCMKEKNDKASRDLYSIRGFQQNEYDPMIPATWFKAPPAGFEGNGKETEALRFQYLALVRYCQNTHSTRKPIQDELAHNKKKLASMQDLASEEHAKVLTLQQEVDKLKASQQDFNDVSAELKRLQNVEQEVEQYRRLNVNPKDLETFKNNKDAIRHYLKLVPMLLEQNEKMKQRLASLGFAMALEPVPNLKEFDLDELDDDGGMNSRHNGNPAAAFRKTASSHTVGRSAHASGEAAMGPSSPFTQRPLKRQRVDSPLPSNIQLDAPTSRDVMPPPQKPLSKMHSVRKLFPSLKKRFAGGRSTPAPGEHNRNYDEHMYEDERWDGGTYDSARNQQPLHSRHRGDTPYMSGALPVEHTSETSAPHGSRHVANGGVEADKSDFTFRTSSPVKLKQHSSEHQPVQLPTEPSYIRLMDGLSYESGMELGLRDPRTNRTNIGHATVSNRQVRPQHEARAMDFISDDWQNGHSFLQQSPLGVSGATGLFPGRSPINRTDGYDSRPFGNGTLNPMTPAPPRQHQAGHQADSVVSQVVERRPGGTSHAWNHRIAEPQDSSSRSAAFQSRSSRMTETQSGRREPPSVNGLSFFDSPVISKQRHLQNKQQRYQIDHLPPRRQFQGRNLDSSGYITRPDAGRSPFFRDSAYGSSRERPTCYQQQNSSETTAIPYPSFQRSSYARKGRLTSKMPSIVSSRSPNRTRPQWEGLQCMGVRSSRNDFDSESVYRDRGLFPSTVRRSVRR